MGRRVDTHGSWIHFKKPALRKLPVLDPRALTATERKRLAAAYDELSRGTVGALPDAAIDPARAAIDEAVARAIGAPDLADLRTMFVREPVICQTTAELLPDDLPVRATAD